MIIDCHAHVFAFPKIKLAAYKYETAMPSAAEMIAIMDAKGIDKAVILPVNSPESLCEQQSIGEVLYICEQYPGRFIPFCNIDPRIMARPDLITEDHYLDWLRQYRQLGCKGMGEFIARMWWDDPRVLMLMSACAKVNFPVLFHTITAEVNTYGLIDQVGLPRLERVLKTVPGVKLIGHSPAFWSEISGDVTAQTKNSNNTTPVAPGGRLIALMRNYPNLYGDVSAGSGFNAITRDPEFTFGFLEEFQDRILFGQDYCSTLNDMQHIEWLTAARDSGNIAAEVFEKIIWKNINDLLGLGLE
jgi:uncharacterized protein